MLDVVTLVIHAIGRELEAVKTAGLLDKIQGVFQRCVRVSDAV